MLNSVNLGRTAYIRANREEPMLGAASTVLIAHFATAHSVLLMNGLYALLTVGVLLPWTYLLFIRYRRRRYCL